MVNLKFESCPQAGTGVHLWLLSQANRCRHGGLSPQSTMQILCDGTRHCGRKVTSTEIQAAVRKAFESNWTAGQRTRQPLVQAYKATSSWPKVDQDLISKVTESGFCLADLWEASPIRFDDEESHAEDIIDTLFPGDPLICVAKAEPQHAITALRSSFRGKLAQSALMVPSAMSSLTGKTQDGKDSPRCLDNTGPRRFLVIEFDNGDADSQAARLYSLSKIAPLTLAVHSGGKSLHGWFFCSGRSDEQLRRFMERCVKLGADPATWCRCQMVRIPDGLRDNGKRQVVYYFNPTTIKV